jgi:hypothetical protein
VESGYLSLVAVWCVTGKLGAGKTLMAVSRIQHYLNANRRVATNLDIYPEHLIDVFSKKMSISRTSDIPTIEDLDAIGLGYEGDFQGDERNGLLVFDECAKWLNSRDYRDKSRKLLVDWMIHARKKRWDIIFIIQSISVMDNQFRELFCEHVVYCRRLDRFNVPIISPLYKLFTGKPLKGVRLHVGIVKYGDKDSSLIVERWWHRGTSIYDAFDTEQGFSDDSSCSVNSVLPPWYTTGRYTTQFEIFKNDFKTFPMWPFLIAGLLMGTLLANYLTPDRWNPVKGAFSCNEAYERLVGCDTTPFQLATILDAHKNANYVDSVEAELIDNELLMSTALDNVFISGSVGTDYGQYEYSFVQKNEVFYPHEFGFKIYDISRCKAVAVSLEYKSIRKNITCIDEEI